ncbi:MAG TPA: ABC transporter ATP-binding protein, partial [Nitrospirales bacterium]|nr:ABC transporter ATP-binding protein [Nitrospirales bacterium]
HILPEATAVCQRVVIINGGRIVAEDSPERLSARLRRSEKISVTMRHPPADAADRLKTLPGVVTVFEPSESPAYLVECQLGRDLREDVARFVVTQGWGLLELKMISMSLEDVFLQLTQHEDEVPAPASEATA